MRREPSVAFSIHLLSGSKIVARAINFNNDPGGVANKDQAMNCRIGT